MPIALDGVAVVVRDDLVYYLLNKPAGYVSTASDPQGRPTVIELVPALPRVFSVGRLDVETEGLLLLTNDGDLTQLLTHPSFGVVKTYLAEVDGDPAPATVRRLREGVELDDGPTAPARVKVVQRRAAHRGDRDRDPRGPQPAGAAYVRRGRASGAATRPHPDRSVARSTAAAGRVARAVVPRGTAAVRSGDAGHREPTRNRQRTGLTCFSR